MRKFACCVACLCAVGSLNLFADQEENKPFIDEDVVEQTDVYTIPLDMSADEDEAALAKIKSQEKKAEKLPQESKTGKQIANPTSSM